MSGSGGALGLLSRAVSAATALDQAAGTLLNPLANLMPGFPALRITDMDIGLPHGHSHPPNLIPPAPMIFLPSTGPVIPIPFLSGAERTLINGLPAARCGDLGLGIWCGGFFPLYEVFLGSSNVWIEGMRAGRMGVDITKHCIFTTPRPSDPPVGPMFGSTITGSPNVLIGGIPMPSLVSLALQGAAKIAGKLMSEGFRLLGKLGKRLGEFLRPGFLKCGILRAEPVNIITGQVEVEQEDFDLPARIPMPWTRRYVSGVERSGVCGYGWETPADARLSFDPDGTVFFFDGTPGADIFESPPSPRPVQALSRGASLRQHDDRLIVRVPEGLEYVFRIADQVGDEIPVEMIRDLCGNSIHFYRDQNGLTGIVDSSDRTFVCRSEHGLLLSLGLKTPSGVRQLVSYSYDRAGNLVEARDALGQPYRYQYDGHAMTRHTSRTGLSFYYEYDSAEDGRCIHAWGDGGLYEYYFHYDEIARRTTVRDAAGHVSLVDYDERGLISRETNALGAVTRYEYDDRARTSAVIDPSGRRTQYVYDPAGNLLSEVRPDGTAVEHAYNADNRPLGSRDANGCEWVSSWNERGLLTEKRSALGGRWQYFYNERGDLIREVDPLGSRVEFSRSAGGHLLSRTDALGRTVHFELDEFGRTHASTDANGRRTEHEYDANGHMVRVRLSSESEVRMAYNANGDLISVHDQNGNLTRFTCAGTGVVTERIRPDGARIRYAFDTEERLTAITNETGLEWRFIRDALGRIVEEIDYRGNSRRYFYNQADEVVCAIDPLGREIQFTYDACGRLESRTYADGVKATYKYDAGGRLVGADNPVRGVSYVYDADGNPVREQQGSFVIENTYDLLGRRTLRRTSSGNTLRFTYDECGGIARVELNERILAKSEYDRAGNLIQERLGGKLERTIMYSADGLVAEDKLTRLGGQAPVSQRAYRYDSAGNLIERRSLKAGADAFTYDAIGQVVRHQDGNGNIHHYTYAPDGNRASESRTIPENGGNGLVQQNGDFTYRYDPVGNLVSRSGPSGTCAFTWGGPNQLESCKTEKGADVSFEYDALGRRAFKHSGGTTTTFYWDSDTMVTEERPGQASREYIYREKSFIPLALAQNGVYFFATDPIGLPHEVVDDQGATAWSATYDAFGSALEIDARQIDNPLRLQGFYADAETGLSYVRNRYLDSTLSAFISHDLLGLGPAANPYRYAPNSWSWVDPLGLNCWNAFQRALKAAGIKLSRKEASEVWRELQAGADRMRRPTVTDPRLQNIVNDLYKGDRMPNVLGYGSTADAARVERMSGQQVFGRDHVSKSQQYINAIRNWFRRTPGASAADNAAATGMTNDMKNALDPSKYPHV